MGGHAAEGATDLGRRRASREFQLDRSQEFVPAKKSQGNEEVR